MGDMHPLYWTIRKGGIFRLYNKCWGDTITVSSPTLFFAKNKHTRLTSFTIKVSKS